MPITSTGVLFHLQGSSRAILKRMISSPHRNTHTLQWNTLIERWIPRTSISDLFSLQTYLTTSVMSGSARFSHVSARMLWKAWQICRRRVLLDSLFTFSFSPELSLNETRQIKRKQLMRAAAFNLHHALRLQPWLRNYAFQCQLFTFEARGGRTR